MTFLDRALAVGFGFAATAGIVWASTVSIPVHRSEQALLRLAWSARPGRIENCRQQSAEELAKMPAHMRQPVVCEGVPAEYRLTVRSGGRLVTDRLVRGGGLRQDRRLYVFEEVPLDPDDAAIQVRFDRLGSDPPVEASADDRSRTVAPGSEARLQPRGETVPSHLVFEQRFRVRPREVILITYSPERRALVFVQDSANAPR
jgi:hypothetical protein